MQSIKSIFVTLVISSLMVPHVASALVGLSNARPNSVIVQADGKTVVAGTAVVDHVQQGFVARYNTDGTPDTGFGDGGVVTTPVGENAVFNAVIQQSDNKLVVAGSAELSTNPQHFVIRYNTDGTIDTSGFGYQGIYTSVQGQSSTATAIAQQSDGKLVLAGVSNTTNFVPRFLVARLNSNGTLDTSGFGTNGVVFTQNGNIALATAIKIQSDGKIVVSGTAQASHLAIRYNTNGTLDNTFGTNGVSSTVVGTISACNASALQTDGKIILAGFVDNNFSLVRLSTGGALDTTWGSSGRVSTSFPSTAEAQALALQSDGNVIAAGYMDNQVALARYTTTGVLDSAYGTTGIVTTSIGSRAWAAALQTDGKLVIAGSANPDLFVARYTTTGILDSSYGDSGTVSDPLTCSTALCAYGQVYNTAEIDVLNNELFTFNSNGTLQNISHTTSSSDITIEQDGIYLATYIIEASAPANLELLLNGSVISSSNFASQGSAIAVGEGIFSASAGDVLTLKNISGYDIFLVSGAVNASITLARIA